MYQGPGSWRTAPPPPSPAILKLVQGRTYAENWEIEKTIGIPRANSTPGLYERKEPGAPAHKHRMADPQRVAPRVVFGSRAWLIANRRWPGWPHPQFTDPDKADLGDNMEQFAKDVKHKIVSEGLASFPPGAKWHLVRHVAPPHVHVVSPPHVSPPYVVLPPCVV